MTGRFWDDLRAVHEAGIPILRTGDIRLHYLVERKKLVADPRVFSAFVSLQVEAGRLVRIMNGVYMLPEYKDKFKLVDLVRYIYPHDVITGRAALEIHQAINETSPSEVETVTNDRNTKPVVIAFGTVRRHYQNPKALATGFDRETRLACPEKALLDFARFNMTSGRQREVRPRAAKFNAKRLRKLASLYRPEVLAEAESLLHRRDRDFQVPILLRGRHGFPAPMEGR